jgi:hypothetical protein
MTKHPTRSIDEDSKTRMGSYWSRTQDVDFTEASRLKMYCPRCKRMVDQDKSFIGEKAQGQEPCVRCHQCGLIHDSRHYKRLMKEERAQSQKQEQRQQKLENKVLQNKGWKI